MAERINNAPAFLESAFELPESAVGDIQFRMLHTALTQKLLDEAKNVPMQTAQYILIERIATTYIYIKFKESAGFETLNPIAQDKQNVYLLSLLAQFQKMLTKATAQEDRDNTLREVRDIIMSALKPGKTSDAAVEEAKALVLAELIGEFKKAGL